MLFSRHSLRRKADKCCTRLAATIHHWGCLTIAILWAFGFPTNHRRLTAEEPLKQTIAVEAATSLLATSEAKAVYARFAQPAAFVWQNRELRSALTELGTTLNFSVWIDREVDPNQLVSYPIANSHSANSASSSTSTRRTLLEALRAMAESINAEVGVVENVLLISPAGKCTRTQLSAIRLHSELHQSFPKLVSATHPLQWQELSTSKELIENVAKKFRIQVPTDLPHDLYHAGQLSNCSLATQLTLLSAGFEREFYIAGRNQIRLRPLSNSDTLEIRYTTGQLGPTALESLPKKWPASKFMTSESGTLVSGLPSCHVDIWSLASDKQRNGKAASSRDLDKNHVWTFRIENIPVEQVLSLLSTNIGFDLKWSDDCTTEMKAKLISVSVESAPLNALLDEVCSAANLKYTREGTTVNIRSGR